MRLLHTKTLTLHEYFGSSIPPYAILSHTWGEDEISFQELQRDNGTAKAGHHKIRSCCEIAASDGFEYIWVDTCCIDKTSSAELSEAINSMYSWYRLSEVCYVYLADVPSGLGLKAAEEAIKRSRWFTRGWTLQELIAPSSVIFYDSQWCELGTKDTMTTLLSYITRINGKVLRDADEKERFSVAQKMSWASMRTTTRIEDIAYCLLGIFGVHMPMLYGEGDHAFIRLQEEIMKDTEDHSIFAWSVASKITPPGLLAATPAWFEGSGNIVHSQIPAFTVNPFSVTNKGIHLYLPIRKYGSIYLAILNCKEVGLGLRFFGICLERQSAEGDVFKRCRCELVIDTGIEIVMNLKQENIFVKQEHRPIKAPSYQRFIVSTKDLQNSAFTFREATPLTWLRRGNCFELITPYSLSESPFHGKLFSAFVFSGVSSKDGFAVILKQTMSVISGQEILCEPSATVVEQLPNLNSSRSQQSVLPRKIGFLHFPPDVETQLNFRTGRISWQHPVGKWWVKLIIKKEMVESERTIVVHIICHSPDQIETSNT